MGCFRETFGDGYGQKKEETQTKTLQASTKSKLGKRRQSFESTSSLASEELREGNPYLLPQYVGLLIDVRLSFIFSLYNLIGIEVVTSLKGAGCPPPVSVDPTETKEDEGFELSDEEEEKKKKKRVAPRSRRENLKPKNQRNAKLLPRKHLQEVRAKRKNLWLKLQGSLNQKDLLSTRRKLFRMPCESLSKTNGRLA